MDKVGLYVPVPHTIHARHECEECHTRFRSYRSLTDLFLQVAWICGLIGLGEYWPLALAGTIAWLIAWIFMKGSVSHGEADTITAGVVIAVLWVLAIVFGDLERGAYLVDHPVFFAAILLGLILTFVWAILVLDRHTNFRLEEL